MTIDKAKQLFDTISDSYQRGKSTGLEFTNLFNAHQNSYYELLLGKIEQSQYGRPQPRIGIGQSENVTTRLSPFIKYATPTATSQVVTKPADFGRLSAMRDNSGGAVDIIEHSKIAGRANSTLITESFGAEYASTWKVWPATISSVELDYYPNKPDDVNWGYNTTGDREEYNAGDSIDPLWLDMDVIKIIGRMLKTWGVAIDDQLLVQYGESYTQKGE